MYRFIALFLAFTLFACSKDTPDSAKVAARPLASGIELSGMDKSIRPQDDFYAYANGGWLATTGYRLLQARLLYSSLTLSASETLLRCAIQKLLTD
jgi:hypothetical protein